MRFKTDALTAVTLDPIVAGALSLATDRDGSLKLIDGSAVTPLRGAMVRDADGRVIKTSSIKVKTPPVDDIPALAVLRCTGHVLVTPYVRDGGQVGVSVVADAVQVIEGAGDVE
ncbi:hypothetical protein [Bifidobacterium simiarum]|uniref:Uncharacterized protein n=1 Tax=Bifidobacterium simiarum TaxID=2045441 RepID=A0A2M9HEX3_9BIFI|nr:hypothetical protein [Bifidobacterium simiarum]PJM75364.1 hypothetical protein CSQ87_04945 [Bifidobacterium simiarum]